MSRPRMSRIFGAPPCPHLGRVRQTCLYVTDLTNYVIYVINRGNNHEIARFGTGGRQAGNFHWPHAGRLTRKEISILAKLNGASRVQKLLRYGPAGCTGEGTAQVGKYPQ